MIQKLKGLNKLLVSKNFVVILFVVGLSLFTVSVANACIYKEYNSDDVGWQVIFKDLGTEHIASPGKVYLPADNFVIKFPFYTAMNHWMYGSRKALEVENISLAATGYTFYFWSSYWLLKRFTTNKKKAYGLYMLPIVWVSSLGIFFYTMFANPSIRNIEIGLDFFFLAVLLSQYYLVDKAKWAKKSTSSKVFLSIVLMLTLSFYLYSDPYSEYIFFLPLLLIVGFKFLRNTKLSSYLNMIIVLLASFASILVWRKVFDHFGFASLSPPGTIVPIQALPASLSLTWHGLIDTLNVNFLGWPIINSLTKFTSLLFLIGVVALHFNKGVLKSLRGNFLHQLLILQILIAVGLFTFSTNSVGVDLSYTHYFVIIPFCVALIGAIAISSLEKSRITNNMLLAGLSLLIIVSVGQNYVLYKDRTIDPSNSYSMPVPLQLNDIGPANYHNNLNLKIAKVALANGLTKGYADYWSASINTYFTQGRVQFLQTWCSKTNKITPYFQIMDSKELQLPAKSSFFLYNNTASFASSNAWCGSPPHLLSQFGQPTKTIPVTPGISFYVYNYDITSKMHWKLP